MKLTNRRNEITLIAGVALDPDEQFDIVNRWGSQRTCRVSFVSLRYSETKSLDGSMGEPTVYEHLGCSGSRVLKDGSLGQVIREDVVTANDVPHSILATLGGSIVNQRKAL